MSLEAAPFSGKGIAPFLALSSPERVAACARATTLVVNLGSGLKVFTASGHLLGPLLALLPHEAAAAGPLATFADHLTRAGAYPEALSCIDAVVGLAPARPLGTIDTPWDTGEPMTWPRQQALLTLWRGECRLAVGDHEGGMAALAEGVRRAEAAEMPPRIRLLGGRTPFRGSIADRRLWALVQAAHALRLRYEGKDACEGRKVKKRKASEKPDPALLASARAYLDEALAVIGPRVAAQHAGLEPRSDWEHPGLTSEHREHAWQKAAYFESGLVDEHLGDLTRARQHLGRAKWLSALANPSHRFEDELLEVVGRLGIENVPLV